jgi:ABC-type multidrug transport system ATPase subunit
MSAAAIRVQGLEKRFGAKRAVDGLTLEVPEGSLYGLIGPNGAGKTTTFSLLAGFLAPDAGVIEVRGEPLAPLSPRVGRLSVLPQDAAMPPAEAPIAWLTFLAKLQRLDDPAARAASALERLGLAGMARQRIGTLSHGQRRRVAIAQAILGDHEVVLLDEPTAGLDPQVAAELRALVRALHAERTIVISSHNLAEIEQLCDHAAIIDKGRVISAGPMNTLRAAASTVRLTLTEAPADPAALVAALSTLAGVVGVAPAREDPARFDLEVDDGAPGRADEAVGRVLQALLARGLVPRSVERGKSLEQRFLEDTRAAS